MKRHSVSRLKGNFKTFICLCISVQSGHLWQCNYKRKQIHTLLSGSQIQLLWIGSKIVAILSLFCFVQQKLMCVTRRYETNNGNLNTTPGAEALKCGTEDCD